MTIHDRYIKAKSISHGFLDGLASWMTDGSSGGTVSTETTMGGRAVLDPGTSAVGDNARIDLDPITPNPSDRFDAVGFRVTFGLNNGAQDYGTTTIQFGFLDTANLNRIYHQPNGADGTDPDVVRVSIEDSDTVHKTRAQRSGNALASELLSDYSADELIHRYQDTFATRVTGASNIPDPTTDYQPKIQIATEDTTANRIMYVYEVEVAYYQRSNV